MSMSVVVCPPERITSSHAISFFAGENELMDKRTQAAILTALLARWLGLLVLTIMAGNTLLAQTDDRPHLVNFTNKYSQWGRLDWKDDRLTYVGDMPIEQAAHAFFMSLYAGFSCRHGSAVPAGPKDIVHNPQDE